MMNSVLNFDYLLFLCCSAFSKSTSEYEDFAARFSSQETVFKNGLNQTRGKMQDVSSNSQGGEIIFEIAFIS